MFWILDNQKQMCKCLFCLFTKRSQS